MAPRSLLLATALLLVLVPVAATADLLGARLSVGSVVTVESHATIDTTVTLSVTGAYSLEETTFQLAPRQAREVRYQGTGQGTVTALMAPVNPTGDGTAIRLTAHIIPARALALPDLPGVPILIVTFLVVTLLGALLARRLRHALP